MNKPFINRNKEKIYIKKYLQWNLNMKYIYKCLYKDILMLSFFVLGIPLILDVIVNLPMVTNPIGKRSSCFFIAPSISTYPLLLSSR